MPFRPYPIIAGPTASGKTAIAVALAEQLNAEVVSADSMQIYADISIGTARPTADEMRGIPHYLLGFLPLNEQYSVARYIEDANRVFTDIYARGRLPLLCGGTGLYIQSFMENIQFFPEASNDALRKELKCRAAEIGGEGLLTELRQVDAETAARLHANDLNRIIRALEVYHTTGRTISEQARLSKATPSPYTPCLFLLNYRERARLYDRIDRRIDCMLKEGILDEARRMLSVSPNATALQAIGYKELIPYLRGELALGEAVELLKRNTRHYAKRQISWFNRMNTVQIIWLDDYPDIATVVETIQHHYDKYCEEVTADE